MLKEMIKTEHDVPRDVDDLHSVPERVGDGVEHVGGAEEQDLGEVNWHVEVVV